MGCIKGRNCAKVMHEHFNVQKIPNIPVTTVLLSFYRYTYRSSLVQKYVITYQLNPSCCNGYTGTPYNCQGKLVNRGLRELTCTLQNLKYFYSSQFAGLLILGLKLNHTPSTINFLNLHV